MTSAICWPNCVFAIARIRLFTAIGFYEAMVLSPFSLITCLLDQSLSHLCPPLLKALCMAASGTLECEWSLVDVWLLADRDDLSGDLKEVLVSIDSPPSEALHFRLKLSLGLISGTSSGPRLCTRTRKQKEIMGHENLQVIEKHDYQYTTLKLPLILFSPLKQMDSCCGRNKIEKGKG